MTSFFQIAVFSIILAAASTGCAEPMPMRASYVPVNAVCADPEPARYTTDGMDFEAPPTVLDFGGLLDDLDAPVEDAFTTFDPSLTGSALYISGGTHNTSPLLLTKFSDDEEEATPKKARKAKAKKERGELRGVVNINMASAEQLSLLPGVGPSLAKRIVDYRDQRKFGQALHLRRVKGIGRAKFESIKEHIVVDGESTLSR
ncbi:MAG: helix-hairpin-helix domain-containing protein [Bradymonadaceae bacterium]|nr:helix-hairpin-helix domain-containing protein [Lujinxingiaceae bacterium]